MRPAPSWLLSDGSALRMWDMAVRTRMDDWLIVWMYGPGDREVTVIYVGSKP